MQAFIQTTMATATRAILVVMMTMATNVPGEGKSVWFDSNWGSRAVGTNLVQSWQPSTMPARAPALRQTWTTGACSEGRGAGLGDDDASQESQQHIKLTSRARALEQMRQGVELAQAGHFEAGLRMLKAARRADPGIAEVHNNIGNVLVEIGKSDDAIDSYNRALELQPTLLQALHNKATALHERATRARAAEGEWGILALNRWQQAEDAYLEALSVRPHDKECLFNLGNLYSERAFVSRALQLYGQVRPESIRMLSAPQTAFSIPMLSAPRLHTAVRMYTLCVRACAPVKAKANL